MVSGCGSYFLQYNFAKLKFSEIQGGNFPDNPAVRTMTILRYLFLRCIRVFEPVRITAPVICRNVRRCSCVSGVLSELFRRTPLLRSKEKYCSVWYGRCCRFSAAGLLCGIVRRYGSGSAAGFLKSRYNISLKNVRCRYCRICTESAAMNPKSLQDPVKSNPLYSLIL